MPLSDLPVICQTENVMFSINSSGCITFETGNLLLYCVLIQTTCGYKMCCIVPTIQLIYTLFSRRSPWIHPYGRRQPLAHKWYAHAFYWFNVLVVGQAQAVCWNNQQGELWGDLSHWFLLAGTFSLNAFETWGNANNYKCTNIGFS